MDLKKEFKDVIKYANKSKKNKLLSVNFAVSIIAILNSSVEKINDEELENVMGAAKSDNVWEIFKTCWTHYS